jgi:2-polyprenyl-3-methyl-5-hydroxy-6-metoxy-1,4-benzoquinol methylase
MDDSTLNYYDKHAGEAAAKYRAVDQTVWRQQFQASIQTGGRVLDVGAGSGRNLSSLLSLGFDAYGTEPGRPGMSMGPWGPECKEAPRRPRPSP